MLLRCWDVMLYLRCWQWRYECHIGNLLSKTASTLMDPWADEECLKKSEHPRLMHMMFTWICQKSIDFASTFFNQNSVIQRVRKSILYCKLQVIVTLLEANNQNTRAVSHPPGCIWLRVVRTHICLCPCECWHLEPLCIHAYTHKYTYIISKILLYVNPCCANSHMSVLLRVLALRTSLHIFTCAHKYTYIPSHISLYMNPMLCKLTYVCSLASALT